MRANTQFPIAFHALMMIAHFTDTRVTSDIVARSAGCNAVTIRNIFSKLKKAGLLSVKAGTGGTALGKPAENITLWDIFAAVESPDADEIFKIHSTTSGYCPVGSKVRGLLSPHLNNAAAAMKAELSKVTLNQMMDELTSTL